MLVKKVIINQRGHNYRPVGHMWPEFIRPASFLSIYCCVYVTVGNFN